ncbi:WYL domain-containing protein [Aquitalea palustris]|uniref:WYL domain-containing protein n=1 Tax=Aquitalea palustris TaxID=2480983 RepID=A0A454JJ17_9NEIS|nr:WYL domain-containing protein [Aquitalea palustris]RMC98541.1 WYL domain-containing protein [Aquitalea palustris]
MTEPKSVKQQRMRAMQGVLAWEGSIGNTRVRELFGLQMIQASRLLAEFRDLMDDQVMISGRAKALIPTTPAKLKTDVSLDEYVRLTKSSSENKDFLFDARVDLTEIDPHVFALLRQAALTQSGVEIVYASMSSPVPNERRVFPHAIVEVGRRWHLRAWCESRGEFRDFNLGRIHGVTGLPETKAPFTQKDDAAWNTRVILQLAAHRALSQEQQLVVRNELFAGTMGRRLSIRACLVQYVIQDLRAAVRPDKETPPDYQIEVSNMEDLNEVLFFK